MNITKLTMAELKSKYFNIGVNLSMTETIKAVTNYVEQAKKVAYVLDSPVQLTIEDGRCVWLSFGSGYSHEHPIRIWYNSYTSKSGIKERVSESFDHAAERELADLENENG